MKNEYIKKIIGILLDTDEEWVLKQNLMFSQNMTKE